MPWTGSDIIRKKAKAGMMYKTLNKLGPESLSSLFTYKYEITNYKLRDVSSGLCLPKATDKYHEKMSHVQWC